MSERKIEVYLNNDKDGYCWILKEYDDEVKDWVYVDNGYIHDVGQLSYDLRCKQLL